MRIPHRIVVAIFIVSAVTLLGQISVHWDRMSLTQRILSLTLAGGIAALPWLRRGRPKQSSPDPRGKSKDQVHRR